MKSMKFENFIDSLLITNLTRNHVGLLAPSSSAVSVGAGTSGAAGELGSRGWAAGCAFTTAGPAVGITGCDAGVETDAGDDLGAGLRAAFIAGLFLAAGFFFGRAIGFLAFDFAAEDFLLPRAADFLGAAFFAFLAGLRAGLLFFFAMNLDPMLKKNSEALEAHAASYRVAPMCCCRKYRARRRVGQGLSCVWIKNHRVMGEGSQAWRFTHL
jgi:hypothetical protein